MNTTDTAVDTIRADTTGPVSDTVPDTASTTRHDTPKWPRRWPLAMLAAPAGIATWSGWVGLGGMTGFGKVHPLPGIADSFTVNSAITLPVGVEAYAAYAMAAWLTSAPVSETTRKFARRSAIAALVLGMLGQVAYHLLAAGHSTHAPWLITTAVACLPVLVLGAGASLAHMLHRDKAAAASKAADTTPDTDTAVSDTLENRVENTTRYVSSTVSEPVSGTVSDTAPTRVENTVPDPTADTVPSVSDTTQNTATDTTPDTDDPNEYVRKMAEQERARKREEAEKRRQRTPARRASATEQPDRDTVARRIFDEYVAEHDEAPAVAELMRRLKAAGYPTGNRTAARLLNDWSDHPLRIAN